MGICFFLEGGGHSTYLSLKTLKKLNCIFYSYRGGPGGGAIPIALTPSVYASCIESLNKGIESLPQTQIDQSLYLCNLSNLDSFI